MSLCLHTREGRPEAEVKYLALSPFTSQRTQFQYPALNVAAHSHLQLQPLCGCGMHMVLRNTCKQNTHAHKEIGGGVLTSKKEEKDRVLSPSGIDLLACFKNSFHLGFKIFMRTGEVARLFRSTCRSGGGSGLF